MKKFIIRLSVILVVVLIAALIIGFTLPTVAAYMYHEFMETEADREIRELNRWAWEELAKRPALTPSYRNIKELSDYSVISEKAEMYQKDGEFKISFINSKPFPTFYTVRGDSPNDWYIRQQEFTEDEMFSRACLLHATVMHFFETFAEKTADMSVEEKAVYTETYWQCIYTLCDTVNQIGEETSKDAELYFTPLCISVGEYLMKNYTTYCCYDLLFRHAVEAAPMKSEVASATTKMRRTRFETAFESYDRYVSGASAKEALDILEKDYDWKALSFLKYI